MSVEWRPGPALDLELEQEAGSQAVVGLWIDGWFVGEQRPDADGRLVVKGPALTGHAGGEVVIRVRSSEGSWGPPWRSLVPDFSGQLVAGPFCRAHVSVGESSTDQTALHTPMEAEPAFEVSDPALALQADAAGMPVFLGGIAPDECVIRLDGVEQAWKAEEGRLLDLYF